MLDEIEKELKDMPIWQDHERRITTLEVTMGELSNKMDRVDNSIKEGNKEQKEMLDLINNRMVDEFFGKRKTETEHKLDLKKKVIGGIAGGLVGGGGIVYVIIEALIK